MICNIEGLPRGSSMVQGKIVKRSRDNDGNVIGCANENPILDTLEYVVECEDGKEAALAASTIAQSMYALHGECLYGPV